MENYIIGMVSFFLTILISIILLGRARTKLDHEKLLIVAKLNSMNMRYLFGTMLLIVLLSVLSQKLHWIHLWISFYAIIFIVPAYTALSFIWTFQKLKKNNFPKSYINTYLSCVIIRVIGIVLLFALAFPY
jgi:hypothetical protein